MLNQCSRPQLTFPRAVEEYIGLTLRKLLSYPVASSLPEAVNIALDWLSSLIAAVMTMI
jgi:hypothetical protein